MIALVSAAAAWLGATLLFASWAPLRGPGLIPRLRPYLVPGRRPISPSTWQGAIALLAVPVGDRLGRLLSPTEPLHRRLRRVHHPLSPAAFRFRQISHAVLALGAAGAAGSAGGRSVPTALLLPAVLGAPLAAFWAHEQALATADANRRARVARELPTIAEQLGMHLGAGRSVPAAIAELGTRSGGACAADLRRVTARIQQGAGATPALREWADQSGVPGVRHLVGVLTLAGDTPDLDRIVEREAAGLRADAHRELLGRLEQRGQQVWVPVTVATLLPGSLLLLVPFLDALRLFARA